MPMPSIGDKQVARLAYTQGEWIPQGQKHQKAGITEGHL